MATKKRVTATSRTATAKPKAAKPTDQLDTMIVEDAAAQQASPDVLAQITTAAAELQVLEARAKQLEEQTEETKREARRLAEQVLPSLMDEAGVPFLGLEDGSKLERTDAVFASIAKDNAREATQWLEDHGYGALVKNGFTITVDKGDVKLAAKVRKALQKAKLPFEEQCSVHPQTLVAFVKESLLQSRKLPKTITYHVQPKVVIKQPKKSKKSAPADRNPF